MSVPISVTVRDAVGNVATATTSLLVLPIGIEQVTVPLFSGGMCRLPDGRVFVSYQRGKQPANQLSRMIDGAGVGPDELVLPGIDPGAAILADGTLVAGRNKGDAYRLHPRLLAGTYDPFVEIADVGVGEVSLQNALGATWACFSDSDISKPSNIRVGVRAIHSLADVGSPVWIPGAFTGALDPVTMTKFQKRPSAGGCGGQLLAAWNQPADPVAGGIRSIWGALSPDGVSWSPTFPIASTGKDLTNPFVLDLGSETRVYYPQPGVAPLGVASSVDGGRTWAVGSATLPPGVLAASRPNLIDVDGQVWLLATWQDPASGGYAIALVEV